MICISLTENYYLEGEMKTENLEELSLPILNCYSLKCLRIWPFRFKISFRQPT